MKLNVDEVRKLINTTDTTYNEPFVIEFSNKKPTGRFLVNTSKNIRANFLYQDNKIEIINLEFPASINMKEALDYIENESWYLSKTNPKDIGLNELELFDRTVFRSGIWKGIEVKPDELDIITSNYNKLKEYGDDNIPVIKNHDSSDVDNKVGKIYDLYRDGNELKAKTIKFIDNQSIYKFLEGIYEDISPYLIKNYSFESGQGNVTLSGWTLRDVSFVLHQADKKLNLTMKEEDKLMDEKEKLELTEKIKTLEEELKKEKEEAENLKKENEDFKKNLEMAEKEKTERAVEDKIKMFEEQGKLIPAQHENNKKLLLSMSEEQLKLWEDGVKTLPDVVNFKILGDKAKNTANPKETAQEILKKAGVNK